MRPHRARNARRLTKARTHEERLDHWKVAQTLLAAMRILLWFWPSD
jgi:hypothetical protein